MNDADDSVPPEFVPESLRQPRHRPAQAPMTSNRNASLLLIGLPLAAFALLAFLTMTKSSVAAPFFLIIGSLVGLVVYFLPTLVAVNRRHRNAMAIAMLNLFLGWSVVGWVVSLVWSCTSHEK